MSREEDDEIGVEPLVDVILEDEPLFGLKESIFMQFERVGPFVWRLQEFLHPAADICPARILA